MSEQNNMNNDNHYVSQLFYPEDFDFDDTNPLIPMPINLQSQSRIEDFLPSATSFSPSDNMLMNSNSMDYEDTGTYTGDYILYQGNLSENVIQGSVNTTNEQLNTHRRDQVETHTNNSYPLPVFFQTFYDSSNLYSGTTNDCPTDNRSQHFDVANNTYVSYSLMQMPTSNEYVLIREERTQSVLGRISAAASIDEMLALTQM